MDIYILIDPEKVKNPYKEGSIPNKIFAKALQAILDLAKKVDIDKQWAWYNSKDRRFHFVYPSEIQVKMCSPDAFSRDMKDREGKIMQVAIMPIEFLQSKLKTDTSVGTEDSNG